MAQLNDAPIQKFLSLEQLLGRRLLRPFYLHSQYNLSPLQINVLLLLGKDASPSMSDIAAHLDISKPNVTPIVDRLIRDGYVQRTANTDDRRIINIQATTEGKKLIRQIRSDMRKSFETRFEAFPAEKVETFLSSVDECLSFLKEMDA